MTRARHNMALRIATTLVVCVFAFVPRITHADLLIEQASGVSSTAVGADSGQTFTSNSPGENYIVTNVSLYCDGLQGGGGDWNGVLLIETGWQSGTIWTSTTVTASVAAWVDFAVPSIELTNNVTYFLRLSQSAGASFKWVRDQNGNPYSGGDAYPGGSIDANDDFQFRIWGTVVAAASAPDITNDGGPSNVTSSSATLNAFVVDGGSDTANGWIYYGTNDGDTATGSWDTNGAFGVVNDNDLLSTDLTGLYANEVYYYRAYATNSAGTNWASATTNFLTDPPAVTLSWGDTNLSEAGTLVITASVDVASVSDVWINVSFNNTTAEAGDYTNQLGSTQIVLNAYATSTNYVLQGLGDADGDDEEFVLNIDSLINGTNGATTNVAIRIVDDDSAPTVTNGTLILTTPTNATLPVIVGSTGGASTTVFTYWGDNDGGTTNTAWDFVITNTAVSEGTFSNDVGGLYYGIRYYYRCYATNSAGTNWAPATTSFVTAVPESTPWTPSNMTTIGWYDASLTNTITSSSGKASQWDDLSGNTNDLTQGNSNYRPITGSNTINGLNAIRSDGTDDYMRNSSVALGTGGDVIVFAFARPIPGDTGGMLSLVSGFELKIESGTNVQYFPNYINFSGAPHPGPSIYSIAVSTAAGRAWGYVDGVQRLNTTVIQTIGPSTDVSVFAKRGGIAFPSYLACDIGEVLIATDVSTNTRQRIEGYLAWKWGGETNLPSGHPYTNAAPVVEGFAIENTSATGVTATTAYLGGTLNATQSVGDVTVYWSTSNNADAAEWLADGTASNAYMGWYTNVYSESLSEGVSLLATNTTYYYTYFVTNAATNIWASPNGSFTTHGPPAISNDGGASNVTSSSGTINAYLSDTGGTSTDVWVFWGTNDGDTASSSWDYGSGGHGTKAVGLVSSNLAGLYANEVYYYRGYASNSVNTNWAGETTNFLTKPPAVTLSWGDTNLAEAGTLVITASVDVASVSDIWINVSFNNTTAEAGDYTNQLGSTQIVLNAFAMSTNYVLQGLDDADGDDEEFVLNIDSLINATNGSTTNVAIMIIDDEGAVAPTVTNGIPTSSVATNATLAGNLLSDGGASTTVYTYWGLTDGVDVKTNWDFVVTNTAVSVGGFSNDIDGLWYGIRYYYRCYATNSAGEDWADSTTNFVTLQPGGMSGTGGTSTNDVGGDRVHVFNNSGTFTATSGGNVEVLVVGGGGGGGGSTGGGGGAGGYVYSNAYAVTSGAYTVTVGDGGVGGINNVGANGSNSTFGALTAYGGGGGGANASTRDGQAGGSGGGGSYVGGFGIGGASTNGQGNDGGVATFWTSPYPTGGGGGAGSIGSNGTATALGHGGIGMSNAISGASTWYAGGGGGGNYNGNGGNGGLGGGGQGAGNVVAVASNGVPNTGGGGGGMGQNRGTQAASGGSGIVIVRYVSGGGGSLSLTNTYATNITTNAAALLGTLESTNSVFDVTVYWSTSNNADSAAWLGDGTASNASLGWFTNVAGQLLSNDVASLSANTTYYYTYFCTNAATSIWANPNGSFTTLSDSSLPSVANGTPISDTATNAALACDVVSTGAASTTVYTYWGLSDGGTVKTNWDFAITNAAVSEGTFSNAVDGLYYGIRYYYRCYATNSAGEDWANSTTNFVTADPIVYTGPNALNFAWYDNVANSELAAIDDSVSNGENGGLFDQTPTAESSWPAALQGKSVWTGEVWQAGSLSDTYCQMWWGYFRPPLTGTYTVYMHGDDYEITWFDVDQDGDFEAGPDDVTRNIPGEEGWNTPHTETVDLTAGEYYAVAFAHNEGGGGDWVNLQITKPGGSAERINPSVAGQDGWWYQDRSGPSIMNTYPTNITANAAVLFGTLDATNCVFDVTLYWSTSNNADSAAWLADGSASNAYIGWYTNVSGQLLSNDVSSLASGTVYYYTYYCTNAATEMWASPNGSLTTLGLSPGNLYWDGGTAHIETDGNGSSAGGSGTWNNTIRNWDEGAVPHRAWGYVTNSAFLGGSAGTVTVNTPISIEHLNISVANYVVTNGTLNFSSGGTITNTGNSVVIYSAITGSPDVVPNQGGNQNLTFSPTAGSMTLGTFDRVADNYLNFGGTTTGNSIDNIAKNQANAKVRFNGTGEWTVTNVYGGYVWIDSGDVIVNGELSSDYRWIELNGGVLHYNNPGAVKGPSNGDNSVDRFYFLGGSLDNSSGGAITTSTWDPYMSWRADWTFIGSQGANSDLYLGAGPVLLTTNRTVTVSNALTTLTVGGTISDGGVNFRYSLTKAGAGTLKLTGTNTYLGDTIVNGGTNTITVPYLSNLASVWVANGATLNLDFTGTNYIYRFYTNGAVGPYGTWGAVGSGADNETALIVGSGILYSATTNFTGIRLWDGGTSDIGTVGNGYSEGGSGTWNNSTLNWDWGAGVAHTNWNYATNDLAILGGVAGTVTLAENIPLKHLNISIASYVVTNNALEFASGGTITNTGSDVTIYSGITGSPDVVPGQDVNLNFTLAPTAESMTIGTISRPTDSIMILDGTTTNNTAVAITKGHANAKVTKNGSGTWTVAGELYGGIITMNAGTLICNGRTYADYREVNLDGGTLVINGSLEDLDSGQFTAGTLKGTGSILEQPLLVPAGGILAPGDDTGTLTVSNNCTINGTLAITVDSNASPNVSCLAVDTNYTLDISSATLDVTSIQSPGGALIIATYGPSKLTGTFAATNMPGGWTIDYNYSAGDQIALISSPATAPSVTNGTPSSSLATTAWLEGILGDDGSAQTTAYTYWGITDGGEVKTNWDFVVTNGVTDVGGFSNDVSGLYYGIRYYYRCYATNAVGDDWADWTTNFVTAAPVGGGGPTTNGMVLWLAADDVDGDGDTTDNPADATAISTWYDKTGLGGGRDAAREGTTDPLYNTNGPNGRPVVSFTADYMSTTYNFDPHTRYTIFSVARYSGGLNARLISSATRNWLFGFHGGLNERWYAEGWIHTTGNAATNWILHTGHITDDADPKATFFRDGTALTVDDTGSGAGNYMVGRLGLGGWRNNNEESNGDIAEILIYDDVLDTNTLDEVGGYLSWKYDLTTAYSAFTPSVSVAITNTYATNIWSDSAAPLGTLESSDAVFDITLYWSTNNNADSAAWLADGSASNSYLGWYTNVSGQVLSNEVSSLTPSTTYYYTYYGTNAATNIWASPNGSFTTLGPPTAPSVTNGTPSSGTATNATLAGILGDDGGAVTTVYTYWGDNDGGEVKTNWDFVVTNAAVSEGGFSNDIDGLWYGIRYYYRCYATNSAGEDWAPSTTNFVTTPPVGGGELGILDETWLAANPNNPDTGSPWRQGDTYHLIFVSLGTRNGTSTNIDDYNDFVQAAADAAGIGATESVTWSAIASTPTVDAKDNAVVSAPVYNMSTNTMPALVATNASDMWDGDIANAILYTEYRAIPSYVTYPPGRYVWTGSGTSGTAGPDPLSATRPEVGASDETDGQWIYCSWAACLENETFRLYGLSEPLEMAIGLTIANTYATNITTNAAALLGTLDSTQSVSDVTVYWSTSNNADSAAWLADGSASSAGLGWYTNVADQLLSNDVSSLTPATTYYYTYVCTNAATYVWASSNGSFTTLVAPVAPSVTNGTPSSSNPTNATLAGILGDDGNATTTVYTYWGLTDGGEVKTNWNYVVTNGPTSEGSFSTDVDGLWYGIRYYYRCYATNSAGEDWANWTTNFVTEPPGSGAYSMQITFTNFAGKGTLTNFPALVKFTTSNIDDYTGFLDTTNGWDLRFWDNAGLSGTALDYEIEEFATNSNSYVWVRIPELTNNLSIWASWGDDTYNSQEAYTTNGDVWSTDHYLVHHLSDVQGADDASSYGQDGTATGMENGDWAAAVIADGLTFDGTVDEYVIRNPISTFPSTEITASLWLKTVGAGDGIISYATSGSDNEFLLYDENSISVYRGGANTGGTGVDVNDGAWHHIVVSWRDSDNVVLVYKDGAQAYSNTLSGGTIPSGGSFVVAQEQDSVGGGFNGGQATAGTYDEIRISSAIRSSNWVWACYMNQGDNHDSFVEYGTPAAGGGGGGSVSITNTWATNVTPSSAALLGTLESTSSVFDVTLYWSTNNNADSAAWLADGSASNSYIGWYTNVADQLLSNDVSSLTASTTYYYTYFATNAATNIWASPNGSFLTLTPPSAPTINNDWGATNIATTTADFNAQLTDDGGSTATLWVFYGLTDGDTNASSWQYTNAVGTASEGLVSDSISSLSSSNVYYYRFFASNDTGTAWAPATKQMMTAPWYLPFYEYLETLDTGDLQGQRGWQVSSNNAAVVQTAVKYAGANACRITTTDTNVGVTVLHEFEENTYSNEVYIDVQAQVGYSDGPGTFTTNATAVFFVNTSSNIVVYDGSSPTILTNTTVTNTQWTRFTTRLVYSNQTWDLSMNGTSVATNLTFHNAAKTSFSRARIVEYGVSPSYFDDFLVTTWPIGTLAVNNANGATNIMGGAGTAFLCGALSGSEADIKIYWGTSDEGTSAGTWGANESLTSVAVGDFSSQISGMSPDILYYYRCFASNSLGQTAWATNTSILMARTMTQNSWALMCSPVDYGTNQNTLDAALGTNLMTGLTGGGDSSTSDAIWYMDSPSTNWQQYWLNNSSSWRSNSDPATIELPVGTGFWVKRYTSGPATDYIEFAGIAPTGSTEMTFSANQWSVFGWPHAEQAEGDASGWGFNAAGAQGGENWYLGDNIVGEYNGAWFLIYMRTDGRWYTRGTETLSTVRFQPGRAYYYYHRGGGMTWTATSN